MSTRNVSHFRTTASSPALLELTLSWCRLCLDHRLCSSTNLHRAYSQNRAGGVRTRADQVDSDRLLQQQSELFSLSLSTFSGLYAYSLLLLRFQIVCDLIEEKRPPGVFAALNDAVATAHADPSAADNSFVQRLSSLSANPHFESRGSKFLIKHYAGDVLYNISGMTDKNKDSLVKDILDLVSTSSNDFLQGLFPEKVDPSNKKRPPTAGDKIKVCCTSPWISVVDQRTTVFKWLITNYCF